MEYNSVALPQPTQLTRSVSNIYIKENIFYLMSTKYTIVKKPDAVLYIRQGYVLNLPLYPVSASFLFISSKGLI